MQQTFEDRIYKIIRLSVMMSLIVATLTVPQASYAASRIKDIVHFEGLRDNILLGYGIVVGLNGSGDNLKNAPFTEKGLSQFLTKLGVNTKGTELKTKNVAAVSLTATLPAFSRSGNKIDVYVSTMGDAKSLQGGTLLAAPLYGPDGEIYAVAQGTVSIGGLIVSGTPSSNASNNSVPTNGLISDGAIVEKEIPFELSMLTELKLSVKNPDISTARRIAESINDIVGEDAALALDPGTVRLTVPEIYGNNVIGLLADIEQVIVEPDQSAKVVIDEASGTIVIGEDVKVDTVAISQGNLLVTIKEGTADTTESSLFANELTEASSSPAGGQFSKNERPGNGFSILRQGANLRDLVSALNSLGVGTRDLITILQTIKVAGALHANIETR